MRYPNCHFCHTNIREEEEPSVISVGNFHFHGSCFPEYCHAAQLLKQGGNDGMSELSEPHGTNREVLVS